MKVPTVNSKRQFFELWQAGVLGNKLRTWDNWADATCDGDKQGAFGFRELNPAGGGGAFEIVYFGQVQITANKWDALGRRYVICEGAPDEFGTIQGEVCRTIQGLSGMLGLSHGLRMRDAIKQGLLTPRSGAAVLALLDRYMDPSSRDDLNALFELYPDATVEFTCYDRGVGDVPGRNTIFWEVRNY